MTDDDVLVVDRLRARLAEGEPSTPVHAVAIRERGRRKLRRRRLATSAAAAAAVAAVVVGGALTSGPGHDARPPVPPAGHPERFDPDALVAAIQRAVHAKGAPWELRRLEASDSAHEWQGSYAVDDAHVLEVWLVYEKPFDEAAVSEQCADDARFNDRCEVLSVTATSITQLTERVTYHDSGAWPLLEDGVASGAGPIPVARRWYTRIVKDFRSDGLVVMAREMVHAPTAAEAEPQWLESTDSLARIATDPDLWFPPFPGALEQGDRPDALDSLAADASEQSALLATRLLIVNRTSRDVLLTSGATTISIEAGKTVRFASDRVCALIPLRATTEDGEFIADYSEPCHGQTWEIR